MIDLFPVQNAYLIMKIRPPRRLNVFNVRILFRFSQQIY